ncbi:hypothetical protein TGAM01_v201646, partial [Trichoderma gamsii]
HHEYQSHSAASWNQARGPLCRKRLLKPLPFATPHRCARSLARSSHEPTETLDHHSVYATVLTTGATMADTGVTLETLNGQKRGWHILTIDCIA